MVTIIHLAEAPEWVSVVADWHHQEWLRMLPRSENASHNAHSEHYQKRIRVLNDHLGSDPIPTTFLATVDDKPVGSASVVFYQFSRNQAKSPWLTNVFVLPHYRRRGIAEQLIDHACAHARCQGVTALMLYTHDQARYYQNRAWEYLRIGHLQRRPVTILQKFL